MKLKSFFLILTGLIAGGISVSKAETPSALHNDDTTSVTSYFSSTGSDVKPSIAVNENEIRAGLLYDAINKKVIWQKNMTSAFPIASLTKMMVALLAVEDVKAGKYSWTDNVRWTRETIVGRRRHARKIYTQVSYSLRDVFKASMIASNNECAEQMARFLGCGNLQETIDRMNARAKELNMMSTYYGNPTGLPAPHLMFDNSSSPSDLLQLTLEMLKYGEVTEIASMGYASIENGKVSSVISNHNHLTIEYSGEVDGLKTGYTKRAGFCLVATTAKCDHRLISIVLGCRGPQLRNEIVRDMINDYYSCIGLDRLGPLCPTPVADNLFASNGRYVTINEKVAKVHVVKSGETISRLASKYSCSIGQIKSWNKKNLRSSRLLKGQRITVFVSQPKSIFIQNPVNGDELDDDKPLMTDAEKKNIDKQEEVKTDESTIAAKAAVEQEKYLYHIVVPGDTLFSIAKRYEGNTVEQLKTLNNITNLRDLKPGTKLKIKVQG